MYSGFRPTDRQQPSFTNNMFSQNNPHLYLSQTWCLPYANIMYDRRVPQHTIFNTPQFPERRQSYYPASSNQPTLGIKTVNHKNMGFL